MILDKERGCKMQCCWRCVHAAFIYSEVAVPSYHSSGSLWKERNAALGREREPLVGVSSVLSPPLRMELEPGRAPEPFVSAVRYIMRILII